MKRIFKTVATSVATAALLATSTMAEEPKKGGTLTMAIQQTPRHLNPAVQSGTATGQPGTQLFASLLRYDEGWNPNHSLLRPGKFLLTDCPSQSIWSKGQPSTMARRLRLKTWRFRLIR